MQESLLQPPTVEPVSLDQALCHLREDDDTAQNELIRGLIRVARQNVEDYTRRAMVRQTWKATYECFPPVIELPRFPVRSVTSLQYVDTAGTTQTWAASNYQVDLTTSDRTRIMPVYGETWPTLQDQTFNAVTVEFVAGDAIPAATDFQSDANQLDATSHPLSDDDIVQVWTSGVELPGGLSEQVNYHVVNATTDAFELATSSGGTPVTLTSDGNGQLFVGRIPESLLSAMYLLIGHLYENREETIPGVALANIPMGIESLLLPYASVRF